MSTRSVCASCKEAVKSGKSSLWSKSKEPVELCGKIWHRQCFRCIECNVVLKSDSECTVSENRPHCMRCAEKERLKQIEEHLYQDIASPPVLPTGEIGTYLNDLEIDGGGRDRSKRTHIPPPDEAHSSITTERQSSRRTMKPVNDDDDDDDYDVYELGLRKVYNNDRRKFQTFQIKAGRYRHTFFHVECDVTESDYGDASSISSFEIGYSKERRDFPPLQEGNKLLHGVVIHCLPHASVFDHVILLAIDLPHTLLDPSGVNRLSILYSPTNTGEAPRWRTFDKMVADSAGNLQFTEKVTISGRWNEAVTSIEHGEVILILRHFCLFAIVVDEREEEKMTASAAAFAKLRFSGNVYNVDVLILSGCNETKMASEEKFAFEKDFKKIATLNFNMTNIGGNLTVELSRDSIVWMNDCAIATPHSQVHHKDDVIAGVMKTTFTVQSSEAFVNGVESFFASKVSFLQTGRPPATMDISMDLHHLVSKGSALPKCSCSECARANGELSYIQIESPQSPPPVPTRPDRELYQQRVQSAYQSLTAVPSTPQQVPGSMKDYTINKIRR